MLRLVLITIGLYAFQLSGIQAKVIVTFEDFKFTSVDDEYLLEPESFITDDQKMFVNITILKRLPDPCAMRMVTLGLSQGEYVVPAGLDIQMDLCDMASETFILGDLLQNFGFSSDDCPPHPGVYGSQGYTMDFSNFPETFPRNNYVTIFTIDHNGKNIVTTQIYFKLE